jgi:hypothetical protein
MSESIRAGGLITKGPAESEFYEMDWDAEHLEAGVEIATSTWTVTLLSGAATGLMTRDNPSILTGNRTTKARFVGGTEGQIYDVSNTIVTDESPARTKDRSFLVLIQDK